jgi:acyl-CoA thioester hydrolase
MQELSIKAVLAEYENRIKIKYTIIDAKNGTVIAKAETIQMCVEIKTRETMFFSPKAFLDKLEGYK